jgi:hypothetical protein
MIQTLLGYDWFIAYGHRKQGAPESLGQQLAHGLADALRARRYRVCIDVSEYHVGQDLDFLTRVRVAASSHFVLVLDSKAADSEWVRRELEVAEKWKRRLLLLNVDDTFASLEPAHPVRRAFGKKLRLAYAGTNNERAPRSEQERASGATQLPPDEIEALADRLQRAFTGQTVDRRERRIATFATVLGLSLATLATYFAWKTRQEAAELKDRQWLTAAERALSSGDRTNARTLLRGVSPARRTGHWRSLAFALSKSAPDVVWQAEELLVGKLDENRFVTYVPGHLQIRAMDRPSRPIDLAWPDDDGLVSSFEDDDCSSYAGGRFLRVRLGNVVAAWDLHAGPSPIARGDLIEIVPEHDWLLVLEGTTATLRQLSAPATILSKAEFDKIPSHWVRRTDAGFVIPAHETGVLLRSQGVERFPFEISSQPSGEVLRSVAIESLEHVRVGAIRCRGRQISVRALGSGWPELYSAEVCDTLFSAQRAIWGDRWVTWDAEGLLLLDFSSRPVKTQHINWTALPDCLSPDRRLVCEVTIDLTSDGSFAKLTVRDSAAHDRAAGSERGYWVHLETGEVTQLAHTDVVAQAESASSAPSTQPAKVLAESNRFSVTYESGELLVWEKPLQRLGARPWRLDFPPPLGPSDHPRVVLGPNTLIAAFSDLPLVRVWTLPPRQDREPANHQGLSWLRDGRYAAWDIYSPEGVPMPLMLSVGIPAAATPEIVFAPPAGPDSVRCTRTEGSVESHLPETVVWSRDGRILLFYGMFDFLWAMDMSTSPPRCVELGGELRLALDNVVHSVTSDESGQWLLASSDQGTRLWSTDELSGEGWLVSSAFLVQPQLSGDGSTLVAASQGEAGLAAWRVVRTGEAPEIIRIPSEEPLRGRATAVSPKGTWVLVAQPFERRNAEVVNIRTSTRIHITGYPDATVRTVFNPAENRLAALSCTHEIFVWDLTDPARPPIRFATGDSLVDFRWVDDERGEVLFADGTSVTLGTNTTDTTTSAIRSTCLTRADRRKYLEETAEEAAAAYSKCMAQSGPR